MPGIAAFLKQTFNQRRHKREFAAANAGLGVAQGELNRVAFQHYSSACLGVNVRSTMTGMLAALESYVRFDMFGWTQLAGNLRADGAAANFCYATEFLEIFRLGQGIRDLKPLTTPAWLLLAQTELEQVPVPYRFILSICLEQGKDHVKVTSKMDEQIDPTNAVPVLRRGLFEAPSMLEIRNGGVSSAALLTYLHENSGEIRPGFQEWFDRGGRTLPLVAAAIERLRIAEQKLAAAAAVKKVD